MVKNLVTYNLNMHALANGVPKYGKQNDKIEGTTRHINSKDRRHEHHDQPT